MFGVLNPHEELPLCDEELGRRQRAEALIHNDEEEGAEPEDNHGIIKSHTLYWTDATLKSSYI